MTNDKKLIEIQEAVMMGLRLHKAASELFMGHDVLVVAIQAHFTRIMIQSLDPGVWERAETILNMVDHANSVATSKSNKKGGH